MSRTFTTTVACPGCGASLDLEGYESVNADRQPELREQILEGTLQVYSCACGESFRGAPELSYMDLGRKQWIAVHSLSALERYREAEDHAQEVFDTSLGKLAPPTAQELGQGIRPRVVFGWGALREKLVARDADVEDDALELLKLQVFKSQGIMPGPGQALRLVEADAEHLRLALVDETQEHAETGVQVPRAAYDEVAASPDQWAQLREPLIAGCWVDCLKLLL
ncbi:MAG: CpXC domain-containing protein [Planctomycetota bacterium]